MKFGLLLVPIMVASLAGCATDPSESALAYLAEELPEAGEGDRIRIAWAVASHGIDLATWPTAAEPILHQLDSPDHYGDALRLAVALELTGRDAPTVTREELRQRILDFHDGENFGDGYGLWRNALSIQALLLSGEYTPTDRIIHNAAEDILNAQWEDGGWDTNGGDGTTIDDTSIALWALSDAGKLVEPWKGEAKEYLLNQQKQDGSYAYHGNINCQSSGLAMLGWQSLGETIPADLVRYVASCQNADGGFSFIKGDASQVWATTQILLGLTES